MKIVVNPEWTKAEVITFREKLKENGGYCPCSIVKDNSTVCPCKEFRESNELGECHCGLYIRILEF